MQCLKKIYANQPSIKQLDARELLICCRQVAVTTRYHFYSVILHETINESNSFPHRKISREEEDPFHFNG